MGNGMVNVVGAGVVDRFRNQQPIEARSEMVIPAVILVEADMATL